MKKAIKRPFRLNVQFFVYPLCGRIQNVSGKNKDKMIHAEENIAPGGTMPKPVAYPDAEKSHCSRQQWTEMVPDLFPGRGCHSFHGLRHGYRIENVIFEPCAQGDMPAFPEFRNRSGKEGLSEVFRKLHPKYFRCTNYGIHGAGEIHIELDGVENGGYCQNSALIFGIIGEDLLNKWVQPVGYNDFFHEAVKDPLKPQFQIGKLYGLHVP